jgi:hypothetical protein
MKRDGGLFIEPSFIELAHDRKFIIVNYFTPEYEDEAVQLRATCKAFNLDYHLQRVTSFGTWWDNLHIREDFLLKMLDEYPQRSLVWIDADGRVKQYPALFDSLDDSQFDFVVHHFRGYELYGGTMWFRNCESSRDLISAWRDLDMRDKHFKEQLNLQRIIAMNPQRWRIGELPPNYAKIFDFMRNVPNAVIEHYQASRRKKRLMPLGNNGDILYSRCCAKELNRLRNARH